MERKSLMKHFATIGGGTFLNMLIGVLTTPIITRMVAPSDYGKLSIFMMYGSIALLVLCMGLDQAFVRYFYADNKLGYKARLLCTCCSISLSVASLFMIGIIIPIYFGLFKFEFSLRMTILLGLYIIIMILNRFSQLTVRLTYKSKLYSAMMIIQKLIYVCFALVLLNCTGFNDFFSLALATTVSVGVATLIGIFAEKDMWNFRKWGNVPINTRELIKYGAPYIISLGLSTIFQFMDKLALNFFGTYSEVGIYSSAMTLINVFAIIQTTFNALWGPMSVEHYEKEPNDKAFYQKGNFTITIIMFFIGIHLILMKDVFALLLGDKYREAAYILPCLIFNPIMYTISETTVGGIVFAKKSKMQIVVGAGACLVNLIGNFILVPMYGGKGAAISTGISYIAFFALRTVIANKYYYIDFKLKRFYSLTGIVFLYAIYNSFYSFGLGTVIGYGLSMVSLIFLYYNEVKQLILLGWGEIKSIFASS